MARRWDPIGELDREVNRLFDRLFDLEPRYRGSPAYPAVNLWEDDSNIYVEAEVPGLSLEDLEIFVSGDEVTIRGKRKAEERPGAVYHRQERPAGEFTRVITLPVEVQADNVEARLANGVLTVTLPKVEAARPRRIEVKAE